MNKLVYLGLSILELSKISMHDFLYGYVKPKYGEKAKICYVDTDSFIVYIKTGDNFENIMKDVETRFGTVNYELDRLLPNRKNKNLIGLIEGKIGGKNMTKFVGIRAKTYSYLTDDSIEDKKPKSTK